MFPRYLAWSNWGLVDLTTPAKVADLQVKLVLDIEPEMNVTSSDVLDFRACTLLGDSLNYLIESVGASTFTVWVKVPLGTQQVIYYWGNSQADSESDGSKTFPFFEDWSDGHDTSKWTTPSGGYTVTDGVLTLTDAINNSMYSQSKIDFTTHIVRARHSASAINVNYKNCFGLNTTQTHAASTYQAAFCFYNNAASLYTIKQSVGLGQVTIPNVADNTNWYISELRKNGTTVYLASTDSAGSSGACSRNVNTVSTASNYIEFEGYTGQATSVDWVFARLYQATEPTVNYIYKFRNYPIYAIESGSENISKAFSSSNDLQLSKPFSTSNDILLAKVFSQYNKIIIENAFSSNSDIQVQLTVSSSNDLRLAKAFLSSSDIALSKEFSSTNAILSLLLTKAFSSSSDIQLSKVFSQYNDINVSKIYASSNDIIETLQKSFTSDSDIQVSKLFSQHNKIIIEKAFSSENDIIAPVSKAFSSSSDIFLSKPFYSGSDIQVWKVFSSENDINAILSKAFSSTSDIQVLKAFSSSSDVRVSKIFSSSNDIIIVVTSVDFDYPLTVSITQNNRTVSITQNNRTVTFN